MRMPGIDRPTLSPHLEQLRSAVMSLPRQERQALMGALHGDISVDNDRRHNEAADAADREMRRRKPDPRQLALLGAA